MDKIVFPQLPHVDFLFSPQVALEEQLGETVGLRVPEELKDGVRDDFIVRDTLLKSYSGPTNYFSASEFLHHLFPGDVRRHAHINAHGFENRRGNIVIEDGNRRINLQQWIRNNEPKYQLMVFAVCNSAEQHFRSKRSLLIYAPHELVFGDLKTQYHDLHMFVPTVGHLSSYTWESYLAALKDGKSPPSSLPTSKK
jgi:hypothetical protein